VISISGYNNYRPNFTYLLG